MNAVISRTSRRVAIALALTVGPTVAWADVQDRLYDFTDAYYSQNGIDPAKIAGRREVGPLAAADKPIFPYQRPVRALLTLPAYDDSGNEHYFTVLGGFDASAFTPNTEPRPTAHKEDSNVSNCGLPHGCFACDYRASGEAKCSPGDHRHVL